MMTKLMGVAGLVTAIVAMSSIAPGIGNRTALAYGLHRSHPPVVRVSNVSNFSDAVGLTVTGSHFSPHSPISVVVAVPSQGGQTSLRATSNASGAVSARVTYPCFAFKGASRATASVTDGAGHKAEVTFASPC